MDLVRKHLTNGQYLTAQYEKKSQFLHHTVGTNAMSAWRWWNSTPDRVGTPYIIDRDGTIIECFRPEVWAFHLGVVGDDNWQEKHSINIELVSAGPLKLEDGEFRFYPLWPNKLRYTVIPHDEVCTLTKPFRGFSYWHKITDDQIMALKELMIKNMQDFPSLEFDNKVEKMFEYDPNIINEHKAGVFTHAAVRKDKSDVFPQPSLIKALKEVQKEVLGIRKATQIPEIEVKPKGKASKKKKK